MLSCLSRVRLVILWTVGHQVPLVYGILQTRYWSGLPFPSLGDLLDSGIEPASLMSPALAEVFFTTSATWVKPEGNSNNSRVLLPGKSHGRRGLVGCSPWGRQESDLTERLRFHFSLSCIGEGNGNPLQYSCLENPRDGGTWWAAVSGVAQSRTRLKRLSSSSSSRAHGRGEVSTKVGP